MNSTRRWSNALVPLRVLSVSMSFLRLPPPLRPFVDCHSFTLRFPLRNIFGQPLRTHTHPKQFHTFSRTQLAAQKSLPQSKNSTSTRKAPNALAYIGGRKPSQTLAESLASKPSPTLLYQAPSYVVYMTTCCLLGGFCFAWSVFNIYGTFISPIGQPGHFVLVSMGITATLVLCLGGYVMSRVRFFKHQRFTQADEY